MKPYDGVGTVFLNIGPQPTAIPNSLRSEHEGAA
jgi:hypothetical protein